MELQIRSGGHRISDGLQEYINRRMAKLEQLITHIVDARLELRTERDRADNEVTVVQVTLHTGRRVLRAEEFDREPNKAIDAVFDKLESQVRRYVSKRKRWRKQGAPDQAADDLASVHAFNEAIDEQLEDDEEAFPQIVRTKRFTMKPMDVDEAIDQMDLVGHDFFFFHNIEGNELNVLYRRRDGSYGLLAPQ